MDRFAERDALGRLVEAVRAGQGRALVLRGDPGMGKTALLGHLNRQAPAAGCRVAHAMGMQSEMELAFAAGGADPFVRQRRVSPGHGYSAAMCSSSRM